MENNLIFVKPYFKSEISEMFNVSKKTLINSWINPFSDLTLKLNNSGYRSYQKQFTIRQVELLFEHLGHPEISYRKNFLPYSNKKAKIKPYTFAELAALYFWDTRTLKNYLKISIEKENYVKIFSKKIDNSHFVENLNKKILNSYEIELIFEKIGHPYLIN